MRNKYYDGGSCNDELQDNVHELCISLEDSSYECPLSIIELTFPFIQNLACKPYYRRNSKHMFKIKELLEENCDSKKSLIQYNYRGKIRLTKYEVPILKWKTEIKKDKQFIEGSKKVNIVYPDGHKGPSINLNNKENYIYIVFFGNLIAGENEKESYYQIKKIIRAIELKAAEIPKDICPLEARVYGSSNVFGHSNKYNYSRISRSTIEEGSETHFPSNVKSGCWEPKKDDKNPYIEVDLGRDIEVTHVSIMGSHPSFYRFPASPYKYMINYKFNDNDKHMNYKFEDKDGNLVEERIDVLGSIAGYKTYFNPRLEGDWVTKFDLMGRNNGGKWFKEGTYDGNYDCFSEKLIRINTFCKVRYLRFVPLEWNNSIAMKIDVFGIFTKAKKEKNVKASHITYTLEEIIPTKYSPEGNGGALRYGNEYNNYSLAKIREKEKKLHKYDCKNFDK